MSAFSNEDVDIKISGNLESLSTIFSGYANTAVHGIVDDEPDNQIYQVWGEVIDPNEDNTYVAEFGTSADEEKFKDVVRGLHEGEYFRVAGEPVTFVIQPCRSMNVSLLPVNPSFRINIITNEKMMVYFLNRFILKNRNVDFEFRASIDANIVYSSEFLPAGEIAVISSNEIIDFNICLEYASVKKIFFRWVKNDWCYAYVLINNM